MDGHASAHPVPPNLHLLEPLPLLQIHNHPLDRHHRGLHICSNPQYLIPLYHWCKCHTNDCPLCLQSTLVVASHLLYNALHLHAGTYHFHHLFRLYFRLRSAPLLLVMHHVLIFLVAVDTSSSQSIASLVPSFHLSSSCVSVPSRHSTFEAPDCLQTTAVPRFRLGPDLVH